MPIFVIIDPIRKTLRWGFVLNRPVECRSLTYGCEDLYRIQVALSA